jgi:hypothetical protein
VHPQSEHRARKLIGTQLDFLFKQKSGIISCAILEIWLARLGPKHRPIEVRCGLGNHENRTFLKGCTDYMTLTVIREDTRGATDKTPLQALQRLNLGRCACAVFTDYWFHLVSFRLTSSPSQHDVFSLPSAHEQRLVAGV